MLAVQEGDVAEETESCDKLLQKISELTAVVTEKKQLALEKAKEYAEQDMHSIVKEKEKAVQELEESLPALEAAKHKLRNLSKSDIKEIRSFEKPPSAVQTVLECIVVLRGKKDVSWQAAKKMMAEANFLKSLMEMEPDAISDGQTKTVKEALEEIKISFDEMKKVSKAGAGLMIFVNALMRCCSCTREISHRMEKFACFEEKFYLSKQELDTIENEVAEIEAEIKELWQSRFEKAKKDTQ